MRIFLTIVIVLVNFILQTTLLPYIAIGGVMPHTGLIIVVSLALLRGSTEGAWTGFVTGVLMDVFFGTSYGYYALIFLLLGFLSGRSQKNFYRENYLLPIIFCCLAVVVYETVIFITGLLSQGDIHVLYFLVRIMVPETVYTAIITIPIYRLLFGINEWLELKEKYKYRLF